MLGSLETGKAHQKKRDEATTLRTLNAFAIDLISIPNVEELFWYVAQKVVGQMNFVDCVIYRADADQTMLTQVAALGDKNPYGRNILNPLVIRFGEGITGKVAANGEPMIVDDLLKDQDYIPDTQPARSEICVPLVYQNRVIGVIDSEHPDPSAFGPAELEVLTTVAAMTSAKLELLAEAERSARRYRDLVQSHAELSQEISNRKALEAELFNARKLESIGRLSGRFAHEFNNLLTVIAGNLEFLSAESAGERFNSSLTDAKIAAARGAKLIRDMLAFSQRTYFQSQPTNLNELVKNICGKEENEVRARLNLAKDLWLADIDPMMAETALLNLIRNASEAMPEGGTPVIGTENITHGSKGKQVFASNLSPGRYVCLGVSDQGKGISSAAMEQIFDPFFSTKPIGDGTGLGLSMVLGFVQQSGGTVSIETTTKGSVFRLYFPARPLN